MRPYSASPVHNGKGVVLVEHERFFAPGHRAFARHTVLFCCKEKLRGTAVEWRNDCDVFLSFGIIHLEPRFHILPCRKSAEQNFAPVFCGVEFQITAVFVVTEKVGLVGFKREQIATAREQRQRNGRNLFARTHIDERCCCRACDCDVEETYLHKQSAVGNLVEVPFFQTTARSDEFPLVFEQITSCPPFYGKRSVLVQEFYGFFDFVLHTHLRKMSARVDGYFFCIRSKPCNQLGLRQL